MEFQIDGTTDSKK